MRSFLGINSPDEGRAGLAPERPVTILDARKQATFLGRRCKGRNFRCPSPS
jgi:hypothetical protein